MFLLYTKKNQESIQAQPRRFNQELANLRARLTIIYGRRLGTRAPDIALRLRDLPRTARNETYRSHSPGR